VLTLALSHVLFNFSKAYVQTFYQTLFSNSPLAIPFSNSFSLQQSLSSTFPSAILFPAKSPPHQKVKSPKAKNKSLKAKAPKAKASKAKTPKQKPQSKKPHPPQ
jgi:hypothetical protein